MDVRNKTRLTGEVLVSLGFFLAAATAWWRPDWIEALSVLEPDGGNGNAEWWIVVALAATGLIVLAHAGRLWLRARRVAL